MSALQDFIKANGRSPQLELVIKPLESSREILHFKKFLTYSFSSSVLIPVDAFSFSFSMPSISGSIASYIQEGDLVELHAGDHTICTGIIDVVDIETTVEGGDVVQIHGRNLLGQLEDQGAVNGKDEPLYGNNIPLLDAVKMVTTNTRIRGVARQKAPLGNFLFATEPGESKMSALQRFVEPLNCMIWGDAIGRLIVGRPNMGATPIGDITCNRTNRFSNVTSIKAVRSSTQIPNIIIPVWSGQENVQSKLPEQRVYNPAKGPERLRKSSHLVQKCVVVSSPSGNSPQSLSDNNAIKVGGANLLQAYALREIARANVGELQVQANVRSHFNDDLVPFTVDQVYNVFYDRAGIDEKMYLYQVEYTLDAQSGSRTSLSFCRLGCIVAGVSVDAVKREISSFADRSNLANVFQA